MIARVRDRCPLLAVVTTLLSVALGGCERRQSLAEAVGTAPAPPLEAGEGTGAPSAATDFISNEQTELSGFLGGQDARFQSALAYVVSDDALILSLSVNPARCEDAFSEDEETDERVLLRLSRPLIAAEAGWRITRAQHGVEQDHRDVGPATVERISLDGVNQVSGTLGFNAAGVSLDGTYSAHVCPSQEANIGPEQDLLAMFSREQIVFRYATFTTDGQSQLIQLSTHFRSCTEEAPSDVLLEFQLGGVGGDEVDVDSLIVRGHRFVRPYSLRETSDAIVTLTQIGGRHDSTVRFQIRHTVGLPGHTLSLHGMIDALNCDP